MVQSGEVARLALKDVLHEWRMSLCVIFAVAAIATPLLLFFGLKSGVIETLKDRMLSNPATVELISATERRLDADWFARTRADPKVAFVIPRTRRLAASAEFINLRGGAQARRSLDLYPSAPGDPLLEHYGVAAPGPDNCVLTAEAGRRLKVAAGATVVVEISRERGAQKVRRELTVAGILPEAAGTVAAAYITLPELEEIESYKDGLAVSARGWSGAGRTAPLVVPEVLVELDRPLDAVKEAMLIQNTGFARFSRLAPEDYAAAHPLLNPGRVVYRIGTVGNPATVQDVLALRDRFRGRRDARFILSAPQLDLALPDGTELEVRAAAPLEQTFAALAGLSAPGRTILVSGSGGVEEITVQGRFYQRTADGAVTDRTVSFAARVQREPQVPPGVALVGTELLQSLSMLATRDLEDGRAGDGKRIFLLKRQGYTGFRMYAASLQDVVALQEQLTRAGIRTVSRADRISEVLSLDHYLSLLFFMIAAASMVGATCCLVASVYANVERKRRELAILRLIGVNRLNLGVFPLTGSLLLTAGGIALSLAVFWGLSALVNALFAYQLTGDEKFCDLRWDHTLGAIGLALVIACISGLLAARRIMFIDPSESLRDE